MESKLGEGTTFHFTIPKEGYRGDFLIFSGWTPVMANKINHRGGYRELLFSLCPLCSLWFSDPIPEDNKKYPTGGRCIINKNLKIMLVEDDTVDVMTVKRALKGINVTNHLIVASDGEEALSYLTDERNKRPGIILLDLNMPWMNGIEFPEVAKKNEVLKSFPVVVLTTSREAQDRVDRFNLGVAGYMVKPVGYAQFVEVMKNINLHWTLSELPEG